ncbi:MAG: hypothetical protein ACE5OR_00895 [bacterium]
MAKAKNPAPQTPEEWVDEIARAYNEAKEALSLGVLAGKKMRENDLFHLAPILCFKFRGLPRSKKVLQEATEAALASYVASTETMGDTLSKPQLAFAFCYVASHLGLGLVSEDRASRVMEFVENQQERLKQLIEPNRSVQRRQRPGRQ